VAAAALALGWARRRRAALAAGGPAPRLREVVSFGVRGSAANALQLLNYRLDLFVLAAVASHAAVGRYAVAVSVSTVLWLLPSAIADVVLPRVAALGAGGEVTAAERRMVEGKGARHAVLVSSGCAVVVAVALLVAVVPVYGERFRGSIDLGLILVPGSALLGVAGVLAATVMGRGRPAYSLYTALIVTPPTLLAYALLIPSLHATGAALASTLSYAATFAVWLAYHRRATGLPLRAVLVPTADELADYRRLLRRGRPRAA
jgi:O-antigen/teichoic acid export membrane protein